MNRDTEVHTATDSAAFATRPSHMALPRGASPFHSGKVLPGGSFIRQFDVPGNYVYFCVPHQDQGMIGKILVLP